MKRLLCLAFAAIALASCGGSGDARLSKSQYEAKLQSALSTGTIPPHTQTDPQIDALAGTAARFRGIAASLSGINAPTDVQALNDNLVAGATKASATLYALVKGLSGASLPTRNRLLAEFDAQHIPGLDEFNRARAGLAAKGYRFKPSAGT